MASSRPGTARAHCPNRLSIVLALLAIVVAIPAAAQRPLGSFPSNRWDDHDRPTANEDVLPFVQESSGELLPRAEQPSTETAPENTNEETIPPEEEAPVAENPWATPPQANDAPVNSHAPVNETPADGNVAPPNQAAPLQESVAPTPQPDIVPSPDEEPLPTGPATPEFPPSAGPVEPSEAPPAEEQAADVAPWVSESATTEPQPSQPRETHKPEPSPSVASAPREEQGKGDVVLAAAEQPDSAPASLPGPVAAATQPATNAEGARKEVADEPAKIISNPFAWRNILQWSLDHGPKLLAIFVGMFVLQFFAKIFSQRIVSVVARSGARGTREEREDRAQTLVGVFHNAASLVIVVGSILMACEEVGIAVGPLLGGAAVLGLAAAFGAQNLIRDYFSGFMILLENQYRINDIIEVNGVSGQVERITMRITVLRDLEGNVHFVPNGKIETVTNMSHGWSRALFVIGIAYKEDADRVMQLLLELAAELRHDPDFGPLILDDAEMLGVDSFGDSAVNVKFVIKTRPLKQWAVKRELLRRIKRRFDELKIEIPFPHRTIFHQNMDAIGESGVKEILSRSREADRAA